MTSSESVVKQIGGWRFGTLAASELMLDRAHLV